MEKGCASCMKEVFTDSNIDRNASLQALLAIPYLLLCFLPFNIGSSAGVRGGALLFGCWVLTHWKGDTSAS
jgi:hypothetical protein